MHGLVNKAIECFVRETHGVGVWTTTADKVELGSERFEPMLVYENALTDRCLSTVSDLLEVPVEAVLEDIGTFLVSHRLTEPVRRLLRFGGVSFTDFILSLDDLPDRARLALPDLKLPPIRVEELNDQHFHLWIGSDWPGFQFVLLGILRALADDYGALVMLEYCGQEGAEHKISVVIFQTAFAEGRQFDLANRRVRP